jgi:hypothetical protein
MSQTNRPTDQPTNRPTQPNRPTDQPNQPTNHDSYEFTSPNGLHVAMSAAAQRGNVYVCGVSAQSGSWDEAKSAAAAVVRSFKIKAA